MTANQVDNILLAAQIDDILAAADMAAAIAKSLDQENARVWAAGQAWCGDGRVAVADTTTNGQVVMCHVGYARPDGTRVLAIGGANWEQAIRAAKRRPPVG